MGASILRRPRHNQLQPKHGRRSITNGKVRGVWTDSQMRGLIIRERVHKVSQPTDTAAYAGHQQYAKIWVEPEL
jgi:hypothetical protein